MTNNIPTNPPSELWDNLVTTALLGTERRPMAQAQANEALGTALAQFDPNDQERTLLGASALLSLYQQAGMVPTIAQRPKLAPSATDERPMCSARASQHLGMMLDGKYGAVLGEWLEALTQAGQRVPETMLPSLLDTCRTNKDIHQLLHPVLGKRGHWLAAQNPAWHYASINVAASEENNDQADEELTETWETSDRTQRMALLRQLRQQRPDKARELLLTTWAKEKARDRKDFLDTFIVGVSQADEPFLEYALDDRSKEVRNVAVGLLIGLPESRLVQRMIDRVAPIFTYTSQPEPKLTVEIALLEKFDAAMQRDQIVETPPYTWGNVRKIGKKAWWLRQMLEAIPPKYWTNVWDASPEDLLEAAAQSNWNWGIQDEDLLEATAQIDWSTTILISAWAAATMDYADPAWANTFLEQTTFKSRFMCEELFEVLPPEQREAYLMSILQKRTDITEHLFQQCQHRWSPEFTKAVLDSIRSSIKNADTRTIHANISLVSNIGLYTPPTMLDAVTNGWPTDAEVWHNMEAAVEACIDTVQFRQDMLKELA